MINSLGSHNKIFRNPEVAGAAVSGVGGTLQGAWRNPQLYAFLKMAGIGYWETQEGFNHPQTIEKMIHEANRLYPGAHNKQMRNMLYQELGGGQAGADAYEAWEHELATKGHIQTHVPRMHREAQERSKAQALTTPEAQLKKLEGKLQHGLYSSIPHAILGAAALLLGPKLLGGGIKALGKGLGSLLGGAEGAGEEAGGSSLLGAGGVALGALAGIPDGLFNTNPLGFLGLSNPTGGGLAGNATGNSRKAIEERYNAKAVGEVAAAAMNKFGVNWRGAAGQKWMEQQLYNPRSRYSQDTRAPIGESITGPHPWAATQLLRQALGAEGSGGGTSDLSSFNESVRKFSEAVEKLTRGATHDGAYGGGAAMHNASFMGAPAVASLASTVPGMVMAAYLGGGHATTPQGAAPATTGATTVAFTGTGSNSGWNAVLQKYSGGSYGLSHVLALAGENPGGGAHRGDRATVEADAKKYGIPFNILWGVYGAESSFGKAASNFGLTGQFPGTGTSGNFGTDARISAQDLAALARALKISVSVHVAGGKVHQQQVRVGGQRPVLV